MFDLDAAIDEWLQRALAEEPELVPHADEIADHLTMVSRSLLADGVPGADALAEAVRGLGHTSDLAGEFRKGGGAVEYFRNLVDADTEASRRDHFALAGANVALSLVWAAVMIMVENSMTWVLMGWLMTTYVPLSILGLFLSKRTPEAGCERGRIHRLLRRL